MIKKENNFDVAVIGGGPAGMMAAGRAGQSGAKVALLEKNKKISETQYADLKNYFSNPEEWGKGR